MAGETHGSLKPSLVSRGFSWLERCWRASGPPEAAATEAAATEAAIVEPAATETAAVETAAVKPTAVEGRFAFDDTDAMSDVRHRTDTELSERRRRDGLVHSAMDDDEEEEQHQRERAAAAEAEEIAAEERAALLHTAEVSGGGSTERDTRLRALSRIGASLRNRFSSWRRDREASSEDDQVTQLPSTRRRSMAVSSSAGGEANLSDSIISTAPT